MGKTRRKFSLRIAVRDAPETVTPAVARSSKRGKNRRPVEPYTKASAQIVRKGQKTRERELQDAVDYCRENNVRGWSAINAGICPSIKDCRTINKQLDNEGPLLPRRQDWRIMTHVEEDSFVRFLMNKNRCLQGVTRVEATKYIHDIVKVYSNSIFSIVCSIDIPLSFRTFYLSVSVDVLSMLRNVKIWSCSCMKRR